MPEVQPNPRVVIFVDFMFEGLRVEDAKLNELALRALEDVGAVFLMKLVQGAADLTNKLRHRKRILQAIQRIGPGDDLRFHHEIYLLLGDESRAIRRAAKSVLEMIPVS